MKSTIEMPVNKQTGYSWLPRSTARMYYLTQCTDVGLLEQLWRAGLLSNCFIPYFFSDGETEFPLLEVYILSHSLIPKALSFLLFVVWKSRWWCLSSFVWALSLRQLAFWGTAKWHQLSLSRSRHVLHLLTHGEWLTNTNMKTILTEQGLDAGGKKTSRKTERVQHML